MVRILDSVPESMDTAGSYLTRVSLVSAAGPALDPGTVSRIRTLLRDLDEPTLAAQSLLRLEVFSLIFRGEWAECVRRQRALGADARERGDDVQAAHASGNLAMCVLEANMLVGDASVGTLEEAEAALLEAIAVLDRSFNVGGSIFNRAWLARLRLAQGRPGEARHLLAEARQMVTEEGPTSEEVIWLHWMEGQVACAQGRRAESLAAHEAAADICARLGLRPFWARFRLDWAAAHAAHGEPSDRERAQELLRESLAAFEEMGLPRYAAVAQQRLDELEVKQMREPAEQR